MKNYYQSLWLLAKRILLLLIVYQIFRVAFFFYNHSLFSALSIKEILGGIRFDLSAIVYINLIIILAHVIVGDFKYGVRYQQIVKIAFFVINTIFFFTSFVDFEYYKFTRVRSTYALITATGMEKDVLRLIPSFIAEFWYFAVVFPLFLFAFWRVIPSKISLSVKQVGVTYKNIFLQSFLMIFIIGLSILAGRGGFQKKPLSRIDALYYSTSQNAALALNTPFCILKTISQKSDIVEKKYFDTDSLDKIYTPVKVYNDSLPITKKNIVVIILESFGQENVGFFNDGKGYTPFLDSLMAQSLVFKNGFANGKLSIDAASSVLSGIPSLMSNSYISSTYGMNRIKAFPAILKEQGYHTSFFHGAFNGSQHFDKFSSIAGLDSYFGKNEYPYKGGEDGAWGIFDEEFMQFFCEKQSDFSQPFLSVLFTLSSHNPYTIPEKYKGKFPVGTAKIHESIGYADYALRQYFASAKKQKWYSNTLFILSADHTSSEGSGFYSGDIGKYLIPIVFFDPSNPALKGVDSTIFQQTDIMPFALKQINFSGKFLSFGNDVTSKGDHFALNFSNGAYNFVCNDYYLAFDGNKVLGAYRWKKDRAHANNVYSTSNDTIQKAESLLKACIQSFNSRVINNKLVP